MAFLEGLPGIVKGEQANGAEEIEVVLGVEQQKLVAAKRAARGVERADGSDIDAANLVLPAEKVPEIVRNGGRTPIRAEPAALTTKTKSGSTAGRDVRDHLNVRLH